MRVKKTGKRGLSLAFSSTPRDQAAAINLMNGMMGRVAAPVCGTCGGLLSTDRQNAACVCNSSAVATTKSSKET